MKVCTKCGRDLPLEKYGWTRSRHGKRYQRADCKDCVSLAKSIYWQKVKRQPEVHERKLAMTTQWQRRNPERVRVIRRRYRLRRALKRRGL